MMCGTWAVVVWTGRRGWLVCVACMWWWAREGPGLAGLNGNDRQRHWWAVQLVWAW